MKIAFRTDASLSIGTGHVMRCLTLAEALRAQGGECHFICRTQEGNWLDGIRARGFAVSALPSPIVPHMSESAPNNPYAAWLGCDWQTDAQESSVILSRFQPDWLLVDHYALDAKWETAMKPYYREMLVIDDLANRPHQADVLLDQNLGRHSSDYKDLVPPSCRLLTGPQFALLRPEFAALRSGSLARRTQPRCQNILIAMGGVDQPNATGAVLLALQGCLLPADCQLLVVMGAHAPWLQHIQQQALSMPWPTEVVVNIANMADRMKQSDFAIAAAGSSAWERCCLGLPSLIVVLAANQNFGALALAQAQAALLIGDIHSIASQLPQAIDAVRQENSLEKMSLAASTVTNGGGVDKVLASMGVGRA